MEQFFATLQDYNLKFSNVPESLHSDKICIRFRIEPLSRAFSNQCVFDKNVQRISEDERPIRIEMHALSNENVRVWTGSAAMGLNCLFPESFKSRVLNSSLSFFFSVKASIYFAEDQLCAVRQWWGVCNSKVSWSAKRKLTVMINASFSE